MSEDICMECGEREGYGLDIHERECAHTAAMKISGHAWELSQDDDGKIILTLKSAYGTITLSATRGLVAFALLDVQAQYEQLQQAGPLEVKALSL